MPQIDEPFRPGGGFDDDAEAAGEFDRNGRFWSMVLRQARVQGRVCLMLDSEAVEDLMRLRRLSACSEVMAADEAAARAMADARRAGQMQAQLQAAETHLRAALRARRQTLGMLVSVGAMLLVAWGGLIIDAARLMGWLE